ncbi:hypothetical protein [Flavobacterium succinicans]|uniref:Uncharacterized protein n=1 Tax=Flavobacterium succinicans TaxID=29536 RepID=A0A199XR70_9FLAO|nr:hypothetical protein [Flavobacterium succinicans]OAZ04253.1 hypothetical protein FLB_12470 [Flavobacterium succinicans]
MRLVNVITVCLSILFTNICLAQPQSDSKGPKPPTLEQRLKMVTEKICLPLKLDKNQTKKVGDVFKDFFSEMDKSIDLKTNPPRMPEKSKVEALAKIRDNKVKKIIPENLFDKYLELEKTIRPPREGNPHMN